MLKHTFTFSETKQLLALYGHKGRQDIFSLGTIERDMQCDLNARSPIPEASQNNSGMVIGIVVGCLAVVCLGCCIPATLWYIR
jgi:hypothetical protein